MPGNYLFNLDSPLAEAIAHVFRISLIVCGVILVVVTAAVAYCVIRFREKPGHAAPAQVAGNVRLEVAWTVVPLLILVYLFFLTLQAMNLLAAPEGVDPDIVVVGHQFWWEVRYPKSGVVTANEIHIPVGRKLLLRLESADVIHSFWVPQLTRKMDMIPGHANEIWLQAGETGVFNGACSEYCGVQHAWMRLLVIAETSEKFEVWQRQQLLPAPPPQGPAAERGQALYQTTTCINCHPASGTAATVHIGPDLTHLATRRTLGAGVLLNTPENLALWLKNPHLAKPGILMPQSELTESQIADMVAYFLNLE